MSDSNEPAGASGPDTPAQNEQPQNSPTTPPQVPAPAAETAPATPTPQEPQQTAPDPPEANKEPETAKSPEPADTQKPQVAAEPPAEASKQATSDTPEKPADTQKPQVAAEQAAETSEQAASDAPEKPADTQEPQTAAEQATDDSKQAPANTPKPSGDKPKDRNAKPQGKPSGKPKQAKRGPGGRSQGSGRSQGAGTPRRRPGKPPKGPSVVIRYGIMGHLGQFRHSLTPPPAKGVNVVIRTDRGVELGEVMTVVSEEEGMGHISAARLEEHIKSNGPDYPFRRDGKVLRLANPQDLIDQRHLNSSARDERKFCAQEIKDMKLDMKLVAVEHLLGGERIIFYFLAEHRVDFRDLVHKLASQYHTRIEMRQVGARDEARLVGDYERCGQECCCKQFLKGLQPVSMRMAKTQKATLDPSKISGRCGRLMCCLRYEDQCYRDLKKCLPHKNIWVKTCDKIGRVTGTQILTQLVQVQLPDGSRGVFANEDIIERNVDPPKPPEPSASRSSRQSDRNKDRGRKQQPAQQGKQKGKSEPGKQQPKPKRKSRPKQERKPRAEAEALDPAWGAVLGDGVTEDKTSDAKPAEKPQTAETAEANPPTEKPAETTKPKPEDRRGDQNGKPPASGERRKKRRRRRGRRSKGKSQGS